jgi:transcription antitermination factor NusG
MLKVSENPAPRFPEGRLLEADIGSWWVARVKPRAEKALAHDLARLGVGYYLPLIVRRTVRPDTGKARKSIVCLFPGYVPLVGFSERKSEILNTGRVAGVLAVPDQDRFIAELGGVRRVIEAQRSVGLSARLAVGRRVVIASGPLAGLAGVVSSHDRPDRLYLNVEMFNQAVVVKTSPEDVIEAG